MSAYGYNRRTTPNLERLAAEGALFERAYSNSSWSKPSTTSFMTGLHHTVLGGYRTPSDPLPDGAPPWPSCSTRPATRPASSPRTPGAARMSSLDRGVDNLVESDRRPQLGLVARSSQRPSGAGATPIPAGPGGRTSRSRTSTGPGSRCRRSPAPSSAAPSAQAFNDMERRLGEATGTLGRSWALRAAAAVFEKAGIDRKAYFDGVRGAFDEAMAFSDHQLGCWWSSSRPRASGRTRSSSSPPTTATGPASATSTPGHPSSGSPTSIPT